MISIQCPSTSALTSTYVDSWATDDQYLKTEDNPRRQSGSSLLKLNIMIQFAS